MAVFLKLTKSILVKSIKMWYLFTNIGGEKSYSELGGMAKFRLTGSGLSKGSQPEADTIADLLKIQKLCTQPSPPKSPGVRPGC